MVFWLHCNKCTRRPQNLVSISSYRLTNCGHILCSGCSRDTDSTEVCSICQRTKIVTHAIDETLPPHIQRLFMSPKALIERAERRIKGTIAFQHSQKILMERCLVRKVVQLWHQLQTEKEYSEVKNQLEIEIVCLKKALKCLKWELMRALSNHREFEKQALQWGFKTLSAKGRSFAECGQSFSKEQDAVQAMEANTFTENGDAFNNSASIIADDISLYSQISDQPPDLSQKEKIDSMEGELTLSCSVSNSSLEECAAAPFYILTSAVLSKKYQLIALRESRTQTHTVPSSKLRCGGNRFTRRKYYRLWKSGGVSHSRPVYSKWTTGVTVARIAGGED